MKKAFTLAEVMIVLTVIGVLTAILLPVAKQSLPDENLMKFKKAHNTLGTVIRELVTSDKYYLNGDLGVKADGTRLSRSAAEHRKYFCQTMADVLNVAEQNCSDSDNQTGSSVVLNNSNIGGTSLNEFLSGSENGSSVTPELLAAKKERLDVACTLNFSKGICKQIVGRDGVWYYDNAPGLTFGIETSTGLRYLSSPTDFPASIHDENGFDTIYKVVCIDIDGIPENATEDDCVNECPFGYGIRADGKILVGARAQEWLERDVNEE